MTRRERLIKVIDYYGDTRENRQFSRFINRYGWENLFTDEAIELYADHVMRDHQSGQKLRRENRERLAQREKANA